MKQLALAAAVLALLSVTANAQEYWAKARRHRRRPS